MLGEALVNTDAPSAVWPLLGQAERRVLEIQTKLHRWAKEDPGRRFGDLFNLVADPAFLMVAWDRVRGNRGARSAGVDGDTAHAIEARRGVEEYLTDVRVSVRTGRFRPLPVKERLIPKPGTRKRRRLGIPTVTDRVVQASLKLVLEPIFEADFLPCSYGFRPNRRAHDAVAETRFLASKTYEWVLEGDIAACFDEISHPALMDRVRTRISDKRVLALVKAFLKAGILDQEGVLRDSDTGTPQGGILSPLLANVALSVLDEHIDGLPGGPRSTAAQRVTRRLRGRGNYRLVRYADDFVVVISGTREHAEQLRDQLAVVLSTMGLRLSMDKTTIAHIDEGLDFLGWRIQRHRKRGSNRSYVYTYPSKKALRAVMRKVKTLCREQGSGQPLEVLLIRLGWLLRGWTTYFRPGVSNATFEYLRAYTWRQVLTWLRCKHPRITWKELRRRYCGGGWWPADGQVTLFDPAKVRTTRYPYRGAAIPCPWPLA